MITHSFLFDSIIIMYALSLLFYFSDFVDANRRAKRLGTGLLVFVWCLQTVYLGTSLWVAEALHQLPRFDYFFFFSWLLVTVSLAASRFFRIELLVFFVNVVGFAVLTVNLINNPLQEPLATWEVVRGLLYVHISLVLLSYAAYTIAAILSGMYLFLHGQLKVKKWSKTMRRLPSLDTIDRYTFRAVLIGTPLLILSLAVAVSSIVVEGQAAMLLDWKVFASLAAVVFYISYVVKRSLLLQPGWQTARWNLLSFGVLMINLFLNSISRFHSFT